tara:strand:- start:90 stop:236 length:147 start_codon:yes stop_codon:yes gene_type:complete
MTKEKRSSGESSEEFVELPLSELVDISVTNTTKRTTKVNEKAKLLYVN